MGNNEYKWKYTSVGRAVRVSLESGVDIAHLPELDRKKWTVLSCPVNGLEFDKKTLDYLDSLTDDMLYEKPENCRFTRMELVLRQYRHISFHTGMLNGQTALATGQFPMWVSETSKYVDDGIFFGRYRKGKVQP